MSHVINSGTRGDHLAVVLVLRVFTGEDGIGTHGGALLATLNAEIVAEPRVEQVLERSPGRRRPDDTRGATRLPR